MVTRAIITVVLLLLAMSESAGAVTLQAKDGSFGARAAAFWEPGVGLTGDTWSLSGGSAFSCCAFPDRLAVVFVFRAETFTQDGVTSTAPCVPILGSLCADETESNARLTVLHDPWTYTLPLTVPGMHTITTGPFTFTAHIDGLPDGFSGGVDIDGSGWAQITGLTRVSAGGATFELLQVTYYVPECTSAVLLIPSLIALAVYRRRHRARFGEIGH